MAAGGQAAGRYRSTCRHGTAYTVITSRYAGIETESTYFVPLGQLFEYWRLKVANKSKRERKLSVFTYCEFASCWNIPNDLSNLQYAQFIIKADMVGGILRHGIPSLFTNLNPAHLDECGRTWMALAGAPVAGYETVRGAFFGDIYRTYANPRAVEEGECGIPGRGGERLRHVPGRIVLAPGESRELIALLGMGTPQSHGQAAVAQFGNPGRCAAEFEALKQHWHGLLGAVKVKTPDPDFDHMANVWGAYNSLITYAWSRHASMIYNGERDGLGFRDTVQDFLGVMPLMKDRVRDRLELMLTGQVATGGAIPVIKTFGHRPGQEKAPRPEEFRSDDCLWFFNAVPDYVAETGDLDFYRKVLPYADEGEATVFGHLRRALEFNLERSGRNGLPCGLHADWNDCVKMGYNGESVMVAFQVRHGLNACAGIADRLGLPADAAWARAELEKLDANIQRAAWDGEWFLWAIGADGHRYGSKQEEEGQIYINTQVWAVISGAATPQQGRSAMDALKERLATPYGIMLSAPPFTNTPPTVMGGVIYNHGIKENAGIFCHTQSWAVIAEAMLGNGDRAYEFYRAFMPAAYNDRAELREIEPYVHCQTTYSAIRDERPGVARVSWLTGAATWAYFSATQYVLGIRPDPDGLRIDPCIPRDWQGFEAIRWFRGKKISIMVRNPNGVCRGVKSLTLNGKKIDGNLIPADQLASENKVNVEME